MAKRKAKNVYLMPEPKWSDLALIDDEAKKLKMVRDMEYFVHYEVADKKCSATIQPWLEKASGLDAELLKKLKRVPDVWFSTFAKHTFIWSKTGYMHNSISTRPLHCLQLALKSKLDRDASSTDVNRTPNVDSEQLGLLCKT